MKATLLCIGKTDESFVKTGIENYVKRLKHYIHFDIPIISDIKNVKHLTQEQQRVREGELILKQLSNSEFVVLLDSMESRQDAFNVAEKIRLVLCEPYQWHEYLIELSVSIGISVYPEQGEQITQLIAAADEAMYKAKNRGKNCIF